MGSALGSITSGGGCGHRDGDGCAGRGDEGAGANGGYATPRRSRTNLRRPRRTLRQVASWSSGIPTKSFKAPTHSFRTSLAFLNTARKEDAADAAFKAAAARRKSSSAAVGGARRSEVKGQGKGRKGGNFGAMGRWTSSNGASPHCAGAAAHSANGQCLCGHDDSDSDSDSDGDGDGDRLHKPDKHGPARLSWSGDRIGFKPMRRVTYANSPTNAA